MIVVSACLAGLEVRYDGGHCLSEKIRRLIEEKKAVAVCPEVLGGLPTPRPPAEIQGGTGEDVLNGKAKVVDCNGTDVTAQFVKGAQLALQKVQQLQATMVVLKEDSPSCGSQHIYDGSFAGQTMVGEGVTAALLRKNGIRVLSEHDFMDMKF